MALTFTTGMTLISNANALANWAGLQFVGTYDTAPAADTSTAAIGTGCVSGDNNFVYIWNNRTSCVYS